MFAVVSGSFDNVGFVNINLSYTSTASGSHGFGLLIGELTGELRNVYVTGSLNVTGGYETYAGGMVALNRGTIADCYSNVSVNAKSTNTKVFAAGLIGKNYGEISESFVYGSISVTATNAVFEKIDLIVAIQEDGASLINCFAWDGQTLTKSKGVATSDISDLASIASLTDIIDYCKTHWGSIWNYKKELPRLTV